MGGEELSFGFQDITSHYDQSTEHKELQASNRHPARPV